MGIRVSGIGAYVPAKTVTNNELATRVETPHEWIAAKTGILERRVAAPDEAPSDMGAQAALRCLSHAGVDKTAVDLIIVACATPDQSQPAVACLVQEKMGVAASRCPAFDVNSVCAGFVFSLNVAQSMMLTSPDRYRNVLVIGTDTFSKILNWKDRRTCVFFGDGAGAVLLSHSQEDERRFHFHLGSDGRGSRFIEVPGGGTRLPATPEVIERRLNTFSMNGPKVWEFAVSTVPETIRALLAEHDMRPSDLDLIILHQSNLRMLEAIMASLELPMEKTVTTLETYGNTAAASIPLTLRKAWELGRLRAGARVMMCGFGGGLSWERRSAPGNMPSVLITGAGSGIGAGLAAELAVAGHHVFATDVSLAETQAVAARIRERGGSADAVSLDVTSDESVSAAVASLSRPVDVLVNNAGLQHVAPLEDFPMAKWNYLLQVMLVGAARLTRALLPGMRARGFGRIVNIGSIHSLVASPYKSAYVAAKHGLVGLTRAVALETSDVDVTINTICPSYVKTPLVDKQISDQARARGIDESQVIREVMLKPMPKGVFIGIDELAGITAFLMSAAARNITGETIVVDGGWTAQ